MGTTNDIGWTVYMNPSHPATVDKAGFEAITPWTKVNGIQSIGERGITHSGIDVSDLQTGFTLQVKGAGAGTDTTLVFREVSGDAGQIAMKAAAEDPEGIISLKLVKGSGTNQAPATGDPVEYALGIVHSFSGREKSDSSHTGFSVVFRNNAIWLPEVNPTVT